MHVFFLLASHVYFTKDVFLAYLVALRRSLDSVEKCPMIFLISLKVSHNFIRLNREMVGDFL